MKRITLTAAIGALALAAGGWAAAPFVSGPQPGSTVTPFDPLHATGPGAGKKSCLV